MARLILGLLCVLGLFVGHASAQEELPPAESPATLVTLNISLWPEYDRPEVLVIYRGQFQADTPLPVPVEIGIPAGADGPTAVAFLDASGAPLNQPYTTREEGEWLVVSFDLETSGFQLEYYAPLSTEASQRIFTFTYVADYAVTALTLDVQEPPSAREFELDPPSATSGRQSDGLSYHLVEAGSLAQGEERSWTLSYQKSGTDLTNPGLPPAVSETEVAAPEQQGDGNSTMLIFLIAFVALVGAGTAAFWLGRHTQTGPGATLSSRSSRELSSQPRGRRPAQSGAAGGLFCPQCGTQLRPDGEFCHKCGTQLRRAP